MTVAIAASADSPRRPLDIREEALAVVFARRELVSLHEVGIAAPFGDVPDDLVEPERVRTESSDGSQGREAVVDLLAHQFGVAKRGVDPRRDVLTQLLGGTLDLVSLIGRIRDVRRPDERRDRVTAPPDRLGSRARGVLPLR